MLFISDEKELQINNGIISLYFYASWMPYHKKFLTMISKIENKYKNVSFLAIDVDYFKSLCKRYDVNSIPEIIIFNNGKEKERINGLILTSAINNIFVELIKKSTIRDGGVI